MLGRWLSTWRYRDTVLTLCTLAFLVTMVGRLAISPVVPAITDEFGVSNTAIGVALSGMWLTYGLVQYPSGVLADRYGDRTVVLVSVGGTATACLIVAVAPIFGVFFLATVLLGALAGLHFSVATTLLSRLYDNVGSAIGVHNAGGTIAGLATPVAVAWVANRYGWRPAVAITFVLGVPIFVLFALRVRPVEPRRTEEPLRDRFRLKPMVDLLSRPSIVFTLWLAVVGEFAWQGIASFLPTLLVERHGQSTALAGALFSLYFVAQGIGQVGIGIVADRVGRDGVTAGCMVVGIVGIAALTLQSGLVVLATGAVLLGVSMSFGPAVLPRFFEEMSDEERSAGFGLVRTVYMIVASLGSVVLGILADLFDWGVSFGFLAVLLAFVAATLAINWVLDLDY
ncbi:MFS transporter [Halopenitus sp. H-Gu1]|uniref:MFS transporter n=1 Tax=Halopenitus sp. H-Gu1 TaxID=3242697 RepID=UPI00359E53E5